MASVANLTSPFFSVRLTQIYDMKKSLFAAILLSGVLVAILLLSRSTTYLMLIVTLLGIISSFFGQSIVWAAEQTEQKMNRLGMANQINSQSVHSHISRGIRFNRVVGNLGLILGAMFVGNFISIYRRNLMSWFVTFGLTSAALILVSFLVLFYER